MRARGRFSHVDRSRSPLISARYRGNPLGGCCTVMSTLFRERFRHSATDLVRRQAQPRGSEALSDAECQELKQEAVPV
jgi:hypothetical protein